MHVRRVGQFKRLCTNVRGSHTKQPLMRAFSTEPPKSDLSNTKPKNEPLSMEEYRNSELNNIIPTREYDNQFFSHFPFLTKKELPHLGIEKTFSAIYEEHMDLLKQKHAEMRATIYEKKGDVNKASPTFSIEQRDFRVGEPILVDEELTNKWAPEGLPGLITQYEHTWNEDRHMIARQCTADVINNLTQQLENGFIKSRGCHPIILTGPNGTGKSITLLHLLLWARSSGWFVFYVPSAWRYVSDFYVTPSETVEGVFDMHPGAKFLLENILAGHPNELKQIRLKTSLPKINAFENFNKTPESTLYDLVKFGIDAENPSEVFLAFKRELDRVHEFPVLIMVDEINVWHGNSGFAKPIDLMKKKTTFIDGNEISIIGAINNPSEASLVNGTMVCAVTSNQPEKHFVKNVGSEELKKMAVEVPPYSLEEYYALVDQYIQSGHLVEKLPSQSLDYIYQLCGGRAKHVSRYYRFV